MKKTSSLSALAAAILFCATGCINEPLTLEQPASLQETAEEGGDWILINAKFPDQGPETRLSYSYNEEGTVLHSTWSSGDVLYRDGASSSKFTYVEPTGENTATFATTAALAANTKYYFTVNYANSSNGFKANRNSYYQYAIQTGNINDITWFDYLFATAQTNADKQLPDVIEFKRMNSFVEVNGINFGEGVNLEIWKVQLVGPCFGTQCQIGLTKTRNDFGEANDVYINNGLSAQPGYYSEEPFNHPNFKVENGVLKDTVLISFFPTLTAQSGQPCKLAFYDTENNIYTLEWESSSAYTSGNVYRVSGRAEKPIVTNIVFEDPVVKSLCTNSYYGDWDLNKDGELSDLEASLVSTIEYKFGGYNGSEGSNITKFNELEYFTGLKEIPAQAFLNCRSLEEITIPESVDRIRADAFNGCSSLKSIVVPENVKEIWGGAFKSCTSLTSVTLPDNADIAPVNASGTQAGQTFQGCTALESITLPSNLTAIGAQTFQESGLFAIHLPSGLKTIGANAFYKCSHLNIITLPASLETVSAGAFGECSNIIYAEIEPGSTFSISDDYSMLIQNGNTAVASFGNKTVLRFPEQITAIAASFANGSSKLEEVHIPGIKSIGTQAFANCLNLKKAVYADDAVTGASTFLNDVSLTEVILPKNATELQASLFQGCSALESITLPAGVTKFNTNVFRDCKSLKTVILPEGITEVAGNLFYGCSSLEHIDIPSTVVTLKGNCFQKCTGLKEIVLPAGLTRIEGSVFDGCSGIQEIKIPDGVTFIGQYAFRGMTGLSEIHIPDGVTNLQAGLIANCTGITEFTFPAKVTTLGAGVFSGTGITSLTLPAGIKTLPNNAFQNTKIQTVALPANLTQIPGNCFDGCTNLKELSIPATVTTIGMNAFQNCTALTSLTLPAGVKTLNNNSFKGSGLTSITLPDAIAQIPNNCFQGCAALKIVVFPANLTTIAMYAFQNCTALESVSLPEKLTTINMYAFDGCSGLKDVSISTGITMINMYAFSKCPSLDWVQIERTTPPTVMSNSFQLNADQDPYPIYVPDSAVEAYKSTGNWASAYASRIYSISSKGE
ncbi:MAG: leucine-rich repeat protein [Bacteroidales bacterium]|nr:leucine-rich repeat protein [Bacteroidales bacterium]